MPQIISTSCKTLGYYVTLPDIFEDTLGSYFENLTKAQQYTLLATLANYQSWHAYGYTSTYTLCDAYMGVMGALNAEVEELLPLLEAEEKRAGGAIPCLIQALVQNIRYTHLAEG